MVTADIYLIKTPLNKINSIFLIKPLYQVYGVFISR